MKRLCFVSPDTGHTRRVVELLEANGIPKTHIYVVARHDVELEDLPDAGPEADDFLPAYERGLALGAVGGLLAGLTALALAPAGMVLGGGAVALITLAGSGIGGLMTGLAGAAFPSSRLKEFEAAIAAGRLLVMADVPRDRVPHYEALIKREDPTVEVMGIEPPAPPFG